MSELELVCGWTFNWQRGWAIVLSILITIESSGKEWGSMDTP